MARCFTLVEVLWNCTSSKNLDIMSTTRHVKNLVQKNLNKLIRIIKNW